jgi:pimeloyl-ACP methyl ester carboxylesterase
VLGCLLTVVVVIVALSAGSLWLVWKRPLAVDASFSRIALGRLGLEQQTITGPAGPMTVWVGGAGPTLVLLHGAGDQAGAWARAARPLLEQHRLVVPDLPGHADSEPRTGPFGVDVVLAGLVAVMDQVCAGERPVLVGNSMGAWVASLYAVDHPDRTERLVFVNGGPLTGSNPAISLFPKTRDEARAMMDALTGPDSGAIPNNVLDDIVRRTGTGPLARFAQTADQMAEFVLDGRLHEITVPVDLVWGDADELMSLEYAHRLLDGLPAARLSTVAGCGHVPHRECPGHFVETLQRVLAQPPPEPDEQPASEEAGP